MTSTTTDGEHAPHDEWASMDGWARLAATLKFVHHGHASRSVEELVHLVGAQKAGARVIERVEQKLAEHTIGHLPTKLPNDSTRQVLLYSKDGAEGLSYIIRLIHELATDGPAASENATVHQLDSLLKAVTSVHTALDQNEARARRTATGRS
ncbi:hypothetical protein ACFCZR_24555 [Streptomyces rubiginosohelvolus]|uniref:hypothetical protein n=1 Tax=Streptomyces rubiginosohelvolus TaxID=67362 RepID=UPI0035DAFB46